MLKNEIEQKIHNIKSINDATSFVASRVLELDSSVKPTTVGFNYDTSIKDYISSKVRFIVLYRSIIIKTYSSRFYTTI